MTALSPLLKDVAEYQKLNEIELVRVVAQSKILKRECKRAVMAQCCQKFLKDLICEEEVLAVLCKETKVANEKTVELGHGGEEVDEEEKEEKNDKDVLLKKKESDWKDGYISNMASLERVAYFTFLAKEKLEYSKDQVTKSLTGGGSSDGVGGAGGAGAASSTADSMGMTQDLEMAQFVMKLAPRIRNLEKNVNQVLNDHLERILQSRMEKYIMDNAVTRISTLTKDDATVAKDSVQVDKYDRNVELLVLGHVLRSFVFMNRGSDAEAIFARVAVMPIVRKYVSIGKLDEGGSRGECAGLELLLQQIIKEVCGIWGDVLRMAESMFAWDQVLDHTSDDDSCRDSSNDVLEQETNGMVDIDLITAGVWVPIVTALLTDPVMKVAIFSPGIASIFQRNYLVLDTFLSELAKNLLTLNHQDNDVDAATASRDHDVNRFMDGSGAAVGMEDDDKAAITHLYYQPKIDTQTIQNVQSRLYANPMTLDYSKRWNLPIYYQLRFGEVCSRLEKAIKGVEMHGWHAKVFTGSESTMSSLQDMYGLELPFFVELFDSLDWLWSPDVFLKPLTHRFLRGALQLIGRVVAFVKEGARGEVKFGITEEEMNEEENERDDKTLDDRRNYSDSVPNTPTSADVDKSYLWCERLQDVAAVSWDISILGKYAVTDYIRTIEEVVCSSSNNSDFDVIKTSYEVSELVSEVMTDASKDISPLVNEMWNDIVVTLLTKQCTAPLAAVKGVAATYRMTNRPPPTQASPFVHTILRPLSEFEISISKRVPTQVGLQWKKHIVDTVSEEYSSAVSELMDTVQKTEEALKNRKVRRAVAGGMSDGEKVRLQLYLDQEAFSKFAEEVGVDPTFVLGIQSLISLTKEAENLIEKAQIP
jgi:hypothetical protein